MTIAPRPHKNSSSLIALLLAGWSVAPICAQTSPGAEPYMPVGHWSRAAVQRLAADGLIDMAKANWTWPLPQDQVRELFESAVATAAQSGRSKQTAEAYARWFDEEFGRRDDRWSVAYAGRLGGGWQAEQGEVLGGSSYWVEGQGWQYPGPLSGSDLRTSAESLDLLVASALGVGGGLRIARRQHDVQVGVAYLNLAAGPIALWGGRRSTALGPSPRGGIVLSGSVPTDGGGFAVPGGFVLPGFLSSLGRIRPTLQLSRMTRNGTVQDPWLAAARISLDLTPSVTVGLNRASMFGGSGNRESLSFKNVALMTVGVTGQLGKSSGFENQVASVDVQARFQVGNVPLRLDAEWGLDDIGGAWKNVPAIMLGLEAPHVGGTGVSIGLEQVYFDGSCCKNPQWYRHGGLGEGWTDRGQLLGHPLAGHGSESSLTLGWILSGAWINGRALRRSRGVENLFAPDREGISWGGELESAWRIQDFAQIRVGGSVEVGESDWERWSLDVGVALLWAGIF